MWLCSTVPGNECRQIQTEITEFKDHYDCAIYGYKHSLTTIENLNKDFSELCQRFNIDPIKLPFANGNYRTENKHYTEYYDNETRELVAKYYKKDIEMFEYKFGD